eukprot:CAMPEP_0170075284 /NCGR_PEP_ID=MMETSP0019_2-20121128/12445_1 /TAXON_ID=98059 /ORGANISM="Dinobryon sp., Strain UTEXLB2267" /LENGTH=583 /DNA_ID=CAMNT_0010286147 /DNA_START=786 /DNA_END=2537 /DNA_ORIENTATION=-
MTDDRGNSKFLIELGEGEVFGERALIKKEPRKANVIANGFVECYYLDSNNFYSMLGEFVDDFNRINDLRNVKSLTMFKSLNDKRLRELMDKLELNKMYFGQRLVCVANTIIFVMSGKFESSLTGVEFSADGVCNVIGSLEVGSDSVAVAGAVSCVSEEGSLAIINVDIVVDIVHKNQEDELRLMKNKQGDASRSKSAVHSLSLASVIGDDDDQLLRTFEERRKATHRMRKQSLASYLCDSISQLRLLQPLGKGTFGNVFLCEHTRTGRLMALKCLDKSELVRIGHHHYVKREVQALKHFQHPFIAEYYGFIQTPRKVFILMEFISGGELWSHLYDEDEESSEGGMNGLSYYESALYAGTMLLALEHIHSRGFCYRDLKPENLLISPNGYLKMVDYGFAKQVPFVDRSGDVQYRTFTLCGTPDYMSPELVLSLGHDRSVDYWSLGVLLYELICGYTPFESNSQQRTFEKIVHSQKHLSFPVDFDPHCKSLIRRLMHSNPALRLGALQNGIADIKSHAFFSSQGVDFDKLMQQQLDMPFIPEPFDGNKHNTNWPSDAMIDLEFEQSVSVTDTYAAYFEDINTTES